MNEERQDRELLEMLAELPTEAEPPRDLWPSISARLGDRAASSEIVELATWRNRADRRVSFSIPQLIAAGLVLAMASGGVVGVAMSRVAPSPTSVAETGPTLPSLMAADTYEA
jgi:hypothetical protein